MRVRAALGVTDALCLNAWSCGACGLLPFYRRGLPEFRCTGGTKHRTKCASVSISAEPTPRSTRCSGGGWHFRRLGGSSGSSGGGGAIAFEELLPLLMFVLWSRHLRSRRQTRLAGSSEVGAVITRIKQRIVRGRRRLSRTSRNRQRARVPAGPCGALVVQ